jgi:hypothetical protein
MMRAVSVVEITAVADAEAINVFKRILAKRRAIPQARISLSKGYALNSGSHSKDPNGLKQ